jgi:acyl-CoA synthetase (AMP-forming)/AMP-acid ligase II
VGTWARKRPLDPALHFEGLTFTWAGVNARVDSYAAWFESEGVVPGDVVALMMDNRPDYLFVVMGLNRAGAVAALINTNATGKALAHALGVSEATRAVIGGEYLDVALQAVGTMPKAARPTLYGQFDGAGESAAVPRINEAVAATPPRNRARSYRPSNNDVFCYIYTSGTTGLPKAAIIKNQRMLGANALFGRLMHQSGRGDVIYVPLPLYHSNALMLGWGSALLTGSAIALRRRFSASNFWSDVRTYRATSFIYIGELCRYLLQTAPHPDEADHSLRVAVGNGLRPDIWAAFQERFAVPVIREFYGSTEGNAPTLNVRGRPGMIGKLGRGQAVIRCDPASGELTRNAAGFCECVKPGETGVLVGRISRTIRFDGYVDKEATRSKILRGLFKTNDAYFDTGDLVTFHAGSWLSFADRLGDTFRWKGENVSTTEVAQALDGAEGIRESTVYGVEVPNAEGRAGMAALRVDESFDVESFGNYVCDLLPAFQRPHFLRLVGDMKVTGTFKHQKTDYRKDGYDPGRVDDPLYLLQGRRYVPLNKALFGKIEAGEVPLR